MLNGIEAFADKIYGMCGIDFRKNLPGLENKTKNRLSELNLSYWDYTKLIERSPLEWDVLVELITINETYFFREDTHFQALRDLIVRDKLTSITIWSAASSTGEEAYSLAMFLVESNLLPIQNIRIFGSDINTRVLSHAKKGWYGKNSLSFRRMPPGYLQKYFTEVNDGYQVNKEIRDLVTFTRFNLKESMVPPNVRNCNVIFCRNVLFYFDHEVVNQILNNFYKTLHSPGYLFLGHSDSISSMNTKFVTVNTSSTFYHEKKEEPLWG